MYCLLSVENNYNQPQNNLICLWEDKPSLEDMAKVFGSSLQELPENLIIQIVSLWKGEEVRIENTDYRIQKIKFGQILE